MQWSECSDGDDQQSAQCALGQRRESLRERECDVERDGRWRDVEMVFGRGINDAGGERSELRDA